MGKCEETIMHAQVHTYILGLSDIRLNKNEQKSLGDRSLELSIKKKH